MLVWARHLVVRTCISVSKVAKTSLYSVLSSSVFLEFINDYFFFSFYEFAIKIIPDSLKKTSFKILSLKY